MGILSFEKTKFVFEPACLNERKLAESADFKLDGLTLRWMTRNVDKAVKLRRFADESAESKFKKRYFTYFQAPEQIIYPHHLEPKDFQFESAFHCLTRSPAYNADEAGLGKTITSILCMNTVPGKTLIICPPFLKYNWQKEINEWASQKFSISIIEKGNADAESFMAHVLIVPDSLLAVPNIAAKLSEHNFTWIFIDEAHRYKEAGTKRTLALMGSVTDQAKRIVTLSGTPIPNGRPIELFPLLDGLAGESIKFRSRDEYANAFCDPKEVELTEWIGGQMRKVTRTDLRGASNLKQLKKELRETLMIRHLKKDVLPDLPSKVRQIIYLDKPKKIEKYEQKILATNSLEDLMGDDSSLGDIASFRRESGLATIKPAASFITELLREEAGPVVVFATHIDVVEGLANILSRFSPITIRGELTAKEKHQRAEAFQSDTKHKILIGNIDSCGVGITLTRARRSVFVEPSWVSGINQQAEDRLHRITQKFETTYHYLLMRDSINEKILRTNFKKERDINLVMS